MSEEISAAEMIASVSGEGSTETSSGGAESHAAPTKQAPTKSEAPTWDPKALKYVVDGREITEPWELVQKRAQLGYNYAQRAEKLKQEMEGFAKTREEAEKIRQENQTLQKWRQYDEYAKQNQEWAKHVEEAWHNRQNLQATGEQNPLAGVVQSLQEKIASWEQRDQQREQQAQQERLQADKIEADKGLDSQIVNVRESYKDVDFDATDEQGRSLEYRVLERMSALGHDGRKPGQFEAAFKDIYFDNLVAKRIESAKETHAKELQKQRKNGLLGVSPAPAGVQSNGLSKSMSYEDLAAMAKKEFGYT